ncbi:MAG: hypothetical protein SFU91_02630 [Chloroherpetonaceae bacterium]|nr:hypothetical protein [Chloroherpetonaceae bacterium]
MKVPEMIIKHQQSIFILLLFCAFFSLNGQTKKNSINSDFSEYTQKRILGYTDTLLTVDFFDLPIQTKNIIRTEAKRLIERTDSLILSSKMPLGKMEKERLLIETIDSLDRFSESLYEKFLASMISNGAVTQETYSEADLDSLENAFAASGFSRDVSGSAYQRDNFSQPSGNNSYFLANGRGSRQQVWRGTDQSGGNGSASLSLSYRFGFGLRLSASGLFIPNQTSPLDQSTLSVGYIFPIVDKLKASVSYSRSFFSNESAQSISALNNDITISLFYNNEFLFISSSFSYTFGKQTIEVVRRLIPLQVVNEQVDAAQRYFYASLSKPFTIENVLGSYLVIEPAFDLSFGTVPKFIDETRQVRRANGTVVNVPSRRIIDNSVFAITNYDFNLFFSFDFGFITIDPELGYSIPVNQDGAENLFNTAIGFSIIL